MHASSDPRPAVGLIGLGTIGTATAERLLDAGADFVLTVPNSRAGDDPDQEGVLVAHAK